MSFARKSLLRVGLIAQNTLRDAARQKIHAFFLLVAIMLIVGARAFREFNFGAPELKFVADCGLAAMAFFGAALVISATAQLFFSEIESGTVLTLLAKPVHRAEFILGKFLAVTVLAGVFCAALGVVLVGVVALHERELMQLSLAPSSPDADVSYVSLAAATCLQWLKLTVLGALALLVASYARTALFTMVSAFLLFVICHLQHLAHDAYARADSVWARGVAALLSWVFPNFQLFGLVDSLAQADAPAAAHVGRVVGYAFAYIMAAIGLAMVSFKRREI